jgi:hypothetical protein
MLSSARTFLSRTAVTQMATRSFALGPASGGEISDELLYVLRGCLPLLDGSL